MKILLVDDDEELVYITTYALHRHGYSVIPAKDGVEAIQRWQSERPDLVLLDVALPDVDGFEVCRQIRHASTTPIIMLTVRHDDDSVEQGFMAGADDYVTKPFSHRQLAIRIQSLLRKKSTDPEVQKPVGELQAAGLILNLQSHEVTRGDVTVRLTPIEFRILYMLALNEGRVVRSSQLADYAWGYAGADSWMLKIHVYHIRRKLKLQKGERGYIQSVPWVGYMLSNT